MVTDMEKYKGTAKLETGETITVEGTLREVADWADNLISSAGACEIRITKIDKGD